MILPSYFKLLPFDQGGKKVYGSWKTYLTWGSPKTYKNILKR